MSTLSYRTCRVRDEYGEIEYEGIFHGFFERADGQDGFVKRYARALIEDVNGICRFVAPQRVEFTDGLAWEMVGVQAQAGTGEEVNDE